MPPSSSTAATQSGDDVKRTNIEVCVRVRPLAISSDAKFFETKASRGGSPPDTRIRPPSRLSRPGSFRKSPTPRKKSIIKPEVSPQAATLHGLDDVRPAWDVVDDDTVQQSASTTLVQGRTHSYTLDRVYGPSSSTSTLFENSVQSLVESAMDGFHASVFCYGQTSTGKTYTMSGTKASPGILPLAIEDIFSLIETGNSPREYLLRVSYMEIYNEQIIDLLSPNPQPIRIFETTRGEVVVRGLSEQVVSSPSQVFSLVREGETRRQVGSTNMNKHSSRSHTIFRVWIESQSSEHGNVRVSSLSLVDLAGSESIRLTGSTGERRKEGQYINKSLMALGQVVYKLSELQRQPQGGDKVHIPYRDSKLTRLLQPSLSGNAQIVVICNISPQASHMEESHNTLKFATRAKRIQQKAVRTEVTDENTLIESYRQEIADLKEQLRQAQEAQKQLEAKNAVAENVGDDDTRELVEAIQKMERLILKTQQQTPPPASAKSTSESLASKASSDLVDLLSLEESPETPQREKVPGADLVDELHRIQGLLSTVLVKRSIFATPAAPAKPPSPQRDKEVEELRAQLHQKDITTSLRKADSSFLQSQLAEKDMLLSEVSKILEAVEKRQIELETENATLREKLARSEENLSISRRSQDTLQRRLEKLEDRLVDRDAGLVLNGSHLNR